VDVVAGVEEVGVGENARAMVGEESCGVADEGDAGVCLERWVGWMGV